MGDFRVQMNRTVRVEKLQRMLPTEAVGIANISKAKSTDADKRLKECLPLISCECGGEILRLPDLQAMNRAIKTHVAEHRKKERNIKNNVTTSRKFSQLLSQLALLGASKQNDNLVLDSDRGTRSIHAFYFRSIH